MGFGVTWCVPWIRVQDLVSFGVFLGLASWVFGIIPGIRVMGFGVIWYVPRLKVTGFGVIW